jgi:hypothetical protein
MVRPAIAGAMFIVTTAEGIPVHRHRRLRRPRQGVLEMIYGIAPRWRGRGLASCAVRLAAR